MKYRVGDHVRVRNDLVLHKRYFMDDGETSNTFVDTMKDYLGQEVVIAIAHTQYSIETVDGYHIPYSWTDEMFEDVVPDEPIELPSLECLFSA